MVRQAHHERIEIDFAIAVTTWFGVVASRHISRDFTPTLTLPLEEEGTVLGPMFTTMTDKGGEDYLVTISKRPRQPLTGPISA